MATLIGSLTTGEYLPANEAGGAVEAVELTELALSPSAMETGQAPSAQQRPEGAELTAGEVIDRPDFTCSMTKGKGSAGHLAIVAVSELVDTDPDPSIRISGRYSTRFSVLDETGALHTGELPFYPFRLKTGKRPNGPVLAGFGGINLQPYSTILPAEGESVRIFMGDTTVYESNHAWLFDLASDGSSYFVIEPVGNELSSRLTIVNLDKDTEIHHDLGSMLASPDGTLAYRASYTPDNEEVHLEPFTEFTQGLGVHYFFKAQGKDPPRRILVPDRGLDDRALFMSSEDGYIFYEGANSADSLHIVKTRFDWPAGPSVPVWRREGPVGTRASRVDASPDGAWLLFSLGTAGTAGRPAKEEDRMIYVLDASTGETVFALPTRTIDAQMRRLSSVLPDQPSENDVGWYMGANFVGNDRFVVRRIKDTDGVVDDTVQLFDVYDMNSISLDAQPGFRVQSNEHRLNPCASNGFPGTLRVAENGRLTYAGLQ